MAEVLARELERDRATDAHLRTEEYALFATPKVKEWIAGLGLDVNGMRGFREEARSGAR